MQGLYVVLFALVIFEDAFFLVKPKPKGEGGLKIIFYVNGTVPVFLLSFLS